MSRFEFPEDKYSYPYWIKTFTDVSGLSCWEDERFILCMELSRGGLRCRNNMTLSHLHQSGNWRTVIARAIKDMRRYIRSPQAQGVQDG